MSVVGSGGSSEGSDLIALPDTQDLPADQLQVHEEIGRGSFGVVSRASFAGADVAVKRIHTGLNRFAEFEHEVAMLRALKHPNIVLFMGVVQLTDGTLYLVQEFVRGGSLRKVLDDKSRPLDWETKLRWSEDISRAVSYMHAKHALHRDLKAENVLLDNGRCKVADLGIARLFVRGSHELMGNVGSPWWRAPEVASQIYGPPADVFSLGVTIYEIITRESGENIRLGMTYEKKKLVYGTRPSQLHDDDDIGPLIDVCPIEFLKIAEDCSADEPEGRPVAAKVVSRLQSALKDVSDCRSAVFTQLKQNCGDDETVARDGADCFLNLIGSSLNSEWRSKAQIPLAKLVDYVDSHLMERTSRGLDEDGRKFFASLIEVEEDALIDESLFIKKFWPWWSAAYRMLEHVLVSTYWRVGLVRIVDGTRSAARLLQMSKEGMCIVRLGTRPGTIVIDCIHQTKLHKILVKVSRDHFVLGDVICPTLRHVFEANNLQHLHTLWPNLPLTQFLRAPPAAQHQNDGDEDYGYRVDLNTSGLVQNQAKRSKKRNGGAHINVPSRQDVLNHLMKAVELKTPRKDPSS